jgi:hypothetical protein
MTRYEIAARHRDGHKLLIGYTPHKSRPGLLATVQKHGLEIIAVLGISESDQIIIEIQPPYCCRIGEWCIVFTGRTEARAKREGELPLFNGHHMPSHEAAMQAFTRGRHREV